jgi:hypothetical protein
MVTYIDPASLKDEPLRLKRLAGADYAVMVKDLRAGRILAAMRRRLFSNSNEPPPY